MRLYAIVLGLLFGNISWSGDLQFDCHPRNERERPYRTFFVTVFNPDDQQPESEVSYSRFASRESDVPESAGILDGFYRDESYQTLVSSQYQMITIDGGNLTWNWHRDRLQLQRLQGRRYRGLFEFPDGSEQLDLPSNSTLVLLCDRLDG